MSGVDLTRIKRPLSKRALYALVKSIGKWENIVRGDGLDHGRKNCALCQEFYGSVEDCRLCPVRKITGQMHCKGTPYETFSGYSINVRDKTSGELIGWKTAFQEHAEDELNFLKSILRRHEKLVREQSK